MTINKAIGSNYAQLIQIPSNSGVFKYILKKSTIEELKEALRVLESWNEKKTARKMISARIRRLEREEQKGG